MSVIYNNVFSLLCVSYYQVLASISEATFLNNFLSHVLYFSTDAYFTRFFLRTGRLSADGAR